MSNATKMNPQISTVEVGTKSLREVFIYPLSVSDQFQLTGIITGVMQEVSSLEDSADDMKIITLATDAIKLNLAKILEYVLDEGETISFDELTNSQLMDVVNIIFEENYEEQIKNLKRLFEKAKKLWSSKQLSPKSSEKPVTD